MKGKLSVNLRTCPFFLVPPSCMQEVSTLLSGRSTLRPGSLGMGGRLVADGGAHCAAGVGWPQGICGISAPARRVLSPLGLCRNCLIKGEVWHPRWGPGPLGGSVGSATVVGDVSAVVLLRSTLSATVPALSAAPEQSSAWRAGRCPQQGQAGVVQRGWSPREDKQLRPSPALQTDKSLRVSHSSWGLSSSWV